MKLFQDDKSKTASAKILEASEITKEEICQQLANAFRLYRLTSPLFLSDLGFQDRLNNTEKRGSLSLLGLQLELPCSVAVLKMELIRRYGTTLSDEKIGVLLRMTAGRDEQGLFHLPDPEQADLQFLVLERTLGELKRIIRKAYDTLRVVDEFVIKNWGGDMGWSPCLRGELNFVTTEELEDRWPDKTPLERENLIVDELGAVYLIGIGGSLPRSGKPHDGRNEKYDWWIAPRDGGLGLNGDMLIPNPMAQISDNNIYQQRVEISSGGMRIHTIQELTQQAEFNGQTVDPRDSFVRHIREGMYEQMFGAGFGLNRIAMALNRLPHIAFTRLTVSHVGGLDEASEHGINILPFLV